MGAGAKRRGRQVRGPSPAPAPSHPSLGLAFQPKGGQRAGEAQNPALVPRQAVPASAARLSACPQSHGESQPRSRRPSWAEQAERYEDMAAFMKSAVEKGRGAYPAKSNLLLCGLQNGGGQRAAWRVLSSIGAKEQ